MEKFTEKLQLDDERIELKYLISKKYFDSILSQLYSNGFNEIYEQRVVNSVYLDDFANSNLYDSLNGLSKRNKTRVRWYSNEEIANLEQKFKINNLGYKIIRKLPFSGKEIEQNITLLNDICLKSESSLKPVSTVKYLRRYFFNAISQSRVTLDFDIETVDLESNIRRVIESSFVLEIKYSNQNMLSLPIEVFNQKFSKYQFSRIGYE